jgi:hypothetical protein
MYVINYRIFITNSIYAIIYINIYSYFLFDKSIIGI